MELDWCYGMFRNARCGWKVQRDSFKIDLNRHRYCIALVPYHEKAVIETILAQYNTMRNETPAESYTNTP